MVKVQLPVVRSSRRDEALGGDAQKQPKQETTGFREVDEYASLLGANILLDAEVVGAARGVSKESPELTLETFEDNQVADDLLELRWEGGIFEVIAASKLEERFSSSQGKRAGGAIALPISQASPGTERSVSDVFLEAVKHIRLSKLTAAAVSEVIGKLEARRVPDPGVHWVNDDGSLGDPVTEIPRDGAPLLAMLHGTFSDTQGSFKHLFSSDAFGNIKERYGSRMIALEQHTVTTSPAGNALDLVRTLPKGTSLDLLSHSRGGLVGELLCLDWADADNEELLSHFFRDGAYGAVQRELRELKGIMLQKKLKVGRFARVACPAAGTLLASERLDRYLNVVLSLAGSVFGASGPAFSFLKALVMAIVGSRTRPDSLPGLEAMMPHLQKGFVPFLNNSRPSKSSQLAIIAGDVQGGSFADRLKAFFIDLYYREPNDFVVDSKSMFRGLDRRGSVRYYNFRGAPGANHFSYFRTAPTQECLAEWLVEGKSRHLRQMTDRLPDELRGGALPGGQERRIPKKEPAGPDPKDKRSVVFLLPGIMGSKLQSRGDRIWINVFRLANGGMGRLSMKDDVKTDGLLDTYYEDLYRFLDRRHRVEPFAYDWRRPIADSAKRLAEAVKEELDAHSRPIYLLAHSMGGLVSRELVASHPEVWKKLIDRGGRLVMLGTPNYGSYVPVQVVTKTHSLMKWLAVVDFRNNLGELTRIVKTFPGLLEMLPGKEEMDLFERSGWKDALEGHQPAVNALSNALRFRRRIEKKGIDKDHMIYVAGHAKETPAQVFSDGDRVRFRYTERGDGTVPWDLGLLQEVPCYFVDAEHGALPGHRDAFEGFDELLTRGTTKRLGRTLPYTSRGKEELFEKEEEPEIRPRYYPEPEDLAATLFGVETEPEEATPALRISVLAGDVREAPYTTIVGHYIGDRIVSAERSLDTSRLGGRLERRYQLGGYPGPLESNVIEDPVVVVGLDRVGSLTVDRLVRTVRQGMIDYALWRRSCSGVDCPKLRFNSVLIGTFGGTAIAVDDSIEAIVQAALGAGERLRQNGVCTVIEEIQFVELYQDVANDAVRAARRVAERHSGRVMTADAVVQGNGALRSRPLSPYAAGWSRRISIKQQADPDLLQFTIASDMARVAPMDRRVQWQIVDQLLDHVTETSDVTRSILFRSLLPWQLVEKADQMTDTVLELDERTAHIPWELLGPARDDAEPLFTRVGVLRQLATGYGRDNPGRTPVKRALVIGEPGGVTPPLPGALEEAEAVFDFLSQELRDPACSFGEAAHDIYKKLLSEEYDIIHIAGHGDFDPKDRRKRGVVLSDNVYLGADDFDGLAAVPRVVFLNCCHLAKGTKTTSARPLRAPGQLASSVAQHLIEMGVRVVVAAGWAVNDHAAKVFAESFYRELLLGRTLMDVVRVARQSTFRACSPQDYTWAAYQVYGDAGYVLPSRESETDRSRPSHDFVSPQEVADHLADLKRRAIFARTRESSRDASARNAIQSELLTLEQRMPARWLEESRVAYELGLAYGELGSSGDASGFAQAVKHLKRAVRGSDTPLEAVEKLANYESRLAEALGAGKKADKAKVDALFKSSIRRLESLCVLEETRERYSLLGGSKKRRGLLLPRRSTQRRSALQEAQKAYRRAFNVKDGSRDPYYPGINVAFLQLMLGQKVEASFLDEIEKSILGLPALDFWSRATLGDIEAIRYAVEAEGTELGTVCTRYEDALCGPVLASPSERDSVERQLCNTVENMPASKARARLDEVRKRVEAL